jgi:hypothetical protein
MTALSAAAAQIPSRVLWWNFDQFFEDSATCLASAFGHFGIEITERDARDILAGPDMRRYSKAPEYAYGASLRQDVLNQARIEFAAEIARGLRWLEHAATEFSSIAKVMA